MTGGRHRAFQPGDWVRVHLTGRTPQGVYMGPASNHPSLVRVRLTQGVVGDQYTVAVMPNQLTLERAA